ncbi:MAG: 2,3-bisphosphoglycerate-independent phosphoglycerate mutase [Alphaproteobacteria bacterium]|nr:2,3-bisphosphoglycerate-independent phosphoglycerate mutase [Alphaproteobacteria bacterium]MBT5389625.1 2,3-bisphosphoglycerate-independent phosphoglycerate mutase [Alphaproteobacteria bacterium]MBT5654569.1 2,3-bisphosphoglycerate-independent phosphoglycerate mutase [Alphaproteobacteria bacterium]
MKNKQSTSSKHRPIVLCVLDGWGESAKKEGNAISMAKTPVWDGFLKKYPHTLLEASGEAVGLPKGQMGNSEVGHLTLGAGRVVLQDLPRISRAFQDGSVENNSVLHAFTDTLASNGGGCHLMGLLSPGGVHSHQDHLFKLIEILSQKRIPIVLHLFLDGRDTPPKSAKSFLKALDDHLKGNTVVGTVSGRYYAMDRDKRWERTKVAYDAIVYGKGCHEKSLEKVVEDSYEEGLSDEFIIPTVVGSYKGFAPGDGLLCFNFRADRVRQILQAILDPEFAQFERTEGASLSCAVGMTEYSADHNLWLKSLFESVVLKEILGEVISKNGDKQLRVAETEKYAHVTFFFNGGVEIPFEGEDRLLVPSPKVATYDLQPEMSAIQMTDMLVERVRENKHDFVMINYANPDMVGHTGDLRATISAIETIDVCLGILAKEVLSVGGLLLITADHGNAEQMEDQQTKGSHTAHTCNPVPFVCVGLEADSKKPLTPGTLANVAPTILELLGYDVPEEMESGSLFQESGEQTKFKRIPTSG